MIEFTTPGGTKVQIGIVTEDDTKPCYRLHIEAQVHRDGRQFGGPKVFGAAEIVEHATAGTCLKIGNSLAPIPATLIPEIRALLAEYAAGMRRRDAARTAVATAHRRQRDLVERAISTSKI